MDNFPQQDWSYYESRKRDADAQWLRSLTADDRMTLYEDMFNVIESARKEVGGDWERLDRWHWEQKIALRQQMVAAFTKLDELQREHAASNDAR